ncbi:MAG: hypothetical protein U0804_28705 [Gemmataceae bacterium]
MTRQARKSLAGSSTPAGSAAFVRAVTATMLRSLTAAGSLTRVMRKYLAGR